MLPMINRNKATAQGDSFMTASFAAMCVSEKKSETLKMARKITALLVPVFISFQFGKELSGMLNVLSIVITKFFKHELLFIRDMPSPEDTYGNS